MRTKKIKDLSNQELVAEYRLIVAKESSWTPGPNGRGAKGFEKTMQRSQLLRIELLSRLGEPEEAIFACAWEKETWKTLVDVLEKLEDYKQEVLVYRIWGGAKKLRNSLKQAAPEVKELLEKFIP
ncbi:DUF6138 family protein [Paenibacillus sp. CMAA1739]|uniref:DUF6138 family protein n=1 Tax=Paenibacillus ottowii TaxID=2315729 RepID=UPI0027307A2A|nr:MULTISPECIES: DUF6138 family protein [Paenibacillus]MDP1510337.1 DUF6138 family protein [Paenibacillus ottowii]MEC4565753.1 DUF6138 family protein [Paenibacillus sp. CMAA1739]